MVEKIEANLVKNQVLNIEHISISGFDLGTKGKDNYLSAIVLGIIFWELGTLPLGSISQWFSLFGVLFLGGAALRINSLFISKPIRKR